MKKSRRTYNGVHLNKKSNTQDVVEQSLTFQRGHPFLLCRYFEGYVESVDKREFYLVEHASAGNALVILTACTTARIGISVIAIIGMTAFLAFEAVCPLYRGQVLKA